MERERTFAQLLDRLILTLFSLRKEPKKAEDLNVLKELSEICLELGNQTKETEKSPDESLTYDAHLIWNWLSLPFAINDRQASILDAAKEYQAQQSSLLSEVLKQILTNSEQTDLILGDISEISLEVRKIINNEK
ncbi:MAG: hypothetical protein ChlgKO_13430 [Chlamydiales bacterium]